MSTGRIIKGHHVDGNGLYTPGTIYLTVTDAGEVYDMEGLADDGTRGALLRVEEWPEAAGLTQVYITNGLWKFAVGGGEVKRCGIRVQ
ncbi:MAG: hypothetical protein QM702_00170 [Rubrivivax sp.]